MASVRRAARISLAFAGLACGTEAPTASDPISEPLVALSAGALHTCGATANGRAFCWGWNQYGQVGDGSRRDRPLPVLVHGSQPLTALTAGGGHTCARAAGRPQCWGLNLSGQLGDGSGADQLVPVPVAGAVTLGSVAAGGAYTCVATADSLGQCWGWNQYGQLGDGTRDDRALPTAVAGGLRVLVVAAAAQHSCALATDSTAYCWGRNVFGQLGNGSTTDTTRPVAVSGGLKFTAITVGFYHSCALTAAGDAYCWGDNAYGQLGDTTAASGSNLPRPVSGGLVFTVLATGGTHTCGVVTGGAAYCWGNDAFGQLGGVSPDVCRTEGVAQPCARLPLAVDGGLSFASLAGALHHTCGITTGAVAYCWGLNDHGQLGDGTTRSRSAPVRVANQQAVP